MDNFSQLTLETPRLLLRPLHPGDAPAILATRGDPEVMRYHSSGPWTSLERAEELIARDTAAMAAGEQLRLGLLPHGEQEIVGSCCLFHLDVQCRRAELGYELRRSAWGQGYMHEALQALLEFAMTSLSLNRVEADIHPDNIASARTVERLGFIREGYLRERWIVEGEISGSLIYGLLASDWRKRA